MLKKYSLLLAIGIIWGSQFIFQQEAIEHFPAIIIAISRSLIGCLILFTVCYFLKLRSSSTKKDYIVYSIIGFLEATMPFILIPWGQQFTSSSITAVLTGTVPFFVVLLGPFIIKSRITLTNLLSITVGFIGLIILFYPSLISEQHVLNLWGISAILVTTISFAVSLLLLSKYTHENPVIISRNILISSSIQLLVLSQTECIGTIFPKSAITRYSHAAIA